MNFSRVLTVHNRNKVTVGIGIDNPLVTDEVICIVFITVVVNGMQMKNVLKEGRRIDYILGNENHKVII